MSNADVTQTHASGPGSHPAENARFVAGTVLAGRYRIVTLLGRGGMGEVYRADDLKLHQPVALKFLPAELGLQSAALARFHREARIARQVSHPHVCRVYDVGEVDGLHFLTMEFIDGEDLASLLRRIRRLPFDKAIEIARQLCAGLAAAHDAGVIHRDLKPANLMIDRRGRARITDFGIAALVNDIGGINARAGTPAYMAPEQLAGEDGTTRSDVYALGLVLHEIFTGVRFTGTAAEDAPTPPDLDPAVAQAIAMCLDADPDRRPASPILVAAALPGGDPLQAALAAGEIPSPEMIAASGTATTVRPVVGVSLVVIVVLLVMTGAWLRTRVNIAAQVKFENSPEVLAYKAREMLTTLGYPDRAGDTAYGFTYSDAHAVLFWYRESAVPMVAVIRRQVGRQPPRIERITRDNPPLATEGMKLLVLDLDGRLVSLRVVSPQFGRGGPVATFDPGRVLTAAGVDPRNFTDVEPVWTPPVATDARIAWTGSPHGDPSTIVRLEAGTLGGILTAFETIDGSQPNVNASVDPAQSRSGAAFAMVSSVVLVLAAALAWTNLRAGWGDRRGALRLGLLLLALRFCAWALNTDHVVASEELTLIRLGLSDAVFDGVAGYVLYLALEPYIRRWWPQVLIGWNRLLAGRFRDPRVGYEILVGLTLTTAATAVNLAVIYATSGSTSTTDLDRLQSIRRVAASLASDCSDGLFTAVTTAFLVALLRQVLRREWLATAALVSLFALLGSLGFGGIWWSGLLMGGSLAVAAVIAVTRFGLVALAAFFFAWTFLQQAPALLKPSAWYAGISLFVFAVIFAIAGWALYIAIAPSRNVRMGFSSPPGAR